MECALQHEVDDFLTESLDHHFKGKKRHFYSTDQQNRPLVSFASKVIDRLGKTHSKLSFMKAVKKENMMQSSNAHVGQS